MAKSKLPGPLERRHLIESEHTPAQALRYAQAYLEEGRDCDAVDFLVRAQADEELKALRGRAVEVGDTFLLRTILRATGTSASREEWASLAEAAEQAGKQRFAQDARAMAERGED